MITICNRDDDIVILYNYNYIVVCLSAEREKFVNAIDKEFCFAGKGKKMPPNQVK